MRNYIILNGVNSNTITGLLISTLPPITKPKIRTQTEEIDGRDGDIVTKLGYSAYEKEFQIGLYGDYDIDEVIAYFNSEGTVVFSNEEDKYYNYQILDQIDYEKLIRFKTASIKMHVQPFKYPLEEEQIQVDATVVEAEGTNLKLQYTSAGATITSELKGDTYQETTTGKNLFNKNNINLLSNYYVDGTGKIVAGSYNKFNWVKLEPTTTYTLQQPKKSNVTVRVGLFSNQPEANLTGTILGIFTGTTGIVQTFTTTSTDIYLGWVYCNTNSLGNYTEQEMVDCIQIEKGNQATDYEEYTGGIPAPNPDYPEAVQTVTGSQNILVESKNIFNLTGLNISEGATATLDNGEITLNLTQGFNLDLSNVVYNLVKGTSYTISFKHKGDALYLRNKQVDRNTNILGTNTDSDYTTYSITLNNINAFEFRFVRKNQTGTAYIRDIQIEKGSEVTEYDLYHSQSYTIDLGTTELCKIGDYQDKIYKNEGTWYLYKEIGKVIYNGSETWTYNSTASYQVFYTNLSGYLRETGTTSICNYYQAKTNNVGSSDAYSKGNNTTSLYRGSDTNINRIYIRNDSITSKNDFQTWLGTHNTTVYYVLETPTTTEITDSTLLEQLEALAGATTYENTTNISVSGSMPVIESASTSGMPNTVITNIGNIYAKPLITIYGSGDIGVYLNQIQVLQIALGDNGSITIDVSKMEAYDKNTQVLMNRLVTGDYMKFLINSGDNNIAFSGNVLGFTMDNYTRWL